jgi:hypothetical protein
MDTDEILVSKVANGFVVKEFNHERNEEYAAMVHVFKTLHEVLEFLKSAEWRR